jgi:hypothetical protein
VQKQNKLFVCEHKENILMLHLLTQAQLC